MRRGEVVLVVPKGDYGKARPAVIVQSDFFNDSHASIVICPFTTTLHDAPLFRLLVQPTSGNGLKLPSQIMVDKVTALRRDRVRETLGSIDPDTLVQLDRALALFLGLGSSSLSA
jgi:mRNA interferase MazF